MARARLAFDVSTAVLTCTALVAGCLPAQGQKPKLRDSAVVQEIIKACTAKTPKTFRQTIPSTIQVFLKEVSRYQGVHGFLQSTKLGLKHDLCESLREAWHLEAKLQSGDRMSVSELERLQGVYAVVRDTRTELRDALAFVPIQRLLSWYEREAKPSSPVPDQEQLRRWLMDLPDTARRLHGHVTARILQETDDESLVRKTAVSLVKTLYDAEAYSSVVRLCEELRKGGTLQFRELVLLAKSEVILGKVHDLFEVIERLPASLPDPSLDGLGNLEVVRAELEDMQRAAQEIVTLRKQPITASGVNQLLSRCRILGARGGWTKCRNKAKEKGLDQDLFLVETGMLAMDIGAPYLALECLKKAVRLKQSGNGINTLRFVLVARSVFELIVKALEDGNVDGVLVRQLALMDQCARSLDKRQLPHNLQLLVEVGDVAGQIGRAFARESPRTSRHTKRIVAREFAKLRHSSICSAWTTNLPLATTVLLGDRTAIRRVLQTPSARELLILDLKRMRALMAVLLWSVTGTDEDKRVLEGTLDALPKEHLARRFLDTTVQCDVARRNGDRNALVSLREKLDRMLERGDLHPQGRACIANNAAFVAGVLGDTKAARHLMEVVARTTDVPTFACINRLVLEEGNIARFIKDNEAMFRGVVKQPWLGWYVAHCLRGNDQESARQVLARSLASDDDRRCFLRTLGSSVAVHMVIAPCLERSAKGDISFGGTASVLPYLIRTPGLKASEVKPLLEAGRDRKDNEAEAEGVERRHHGSDSSRRKFDRRQ